jgi:hypothetical protein
VGTVKASTQATQIEVLATVDRSRPGTIRAIMTNSSYVRQQWKLAETAWGARPSAKQKKKRKAQSGEWFWRPLVAKDTDDVVLSPQMKKLSLGHYTPSNLSSSSAPPPIISDPRPSPTERLHERYAEWAEQKVASDVRAKAAVKAARALEVRNV